MYKHNLKQLEVYATIKLDTNGHPFYIIVDHKNMLTSDTIQYGSFDRRKVLNYTELPTKKAVKDKLKQLIGIGYDMTDKFNQKEGRKMKLLLIAISTLNMLTLDTHAIYYEHIAIETSEAVYHLEEDYSITVTHEEVDRIGS